VPGAANHTRAPGIGPSPLLSTALRENDAPVPTLAGGATHKMLGAWVTEKAFDTVLGA
jgi:hypothetical protein